MSGRRGVETMFFMAINISYYALYVSGQAGRRWFETVFLFLFGNK
jgi:hypothetical protein